MKPSGSFQMRGGWPRPDKAVLVFLIANVVIYVVQLIVLRAGGSIDSVLLRPSDVLHRGHLWQIATYMWLHSPESPSHLLLNMVWLWMFGTQLESWWGTRRFVIAYFVFGFSGAFLTLAVALSSNISVLNPLLGGFMRSAHLGASGAVMGITIAWGITFADRTMNLLFFGEMKGKTFVLIVVAIELLVALSFNPISSTSHFGGMIGAAVLTKGLWKPKRWKELFQGAKHKAELSKRRRKIERQLRVLEGGKSPDESDSGPADPKKWN